MASTPSRPSSPRSWRSCGRRLMRRWPLMPPSITTWATCTPLAPYSRAMLCEIMRSPALAAANWAEPARSLAADQEAGETADPPEVLEQLRGDLAEIDHLVVAGIDDDIGGIEA